MDCSTPGLPVHHQLPESTKPISIESVMPSNHHILCRPLLLLPSIFPSIRVFLNESDLRIRYWSCSFKISPTNKTQDWSPLGWTDWISLQSKGLSRVFSNTTVQKHLFFNNISNIKCLKISVIYIYIYTYIHTHITMCTVNVFMYTCTQSIFKNIV